jgi:ATP-dependent DNA helicase RecG
MPYYLKRDGKNDGTYIRIGATNRKASFENVIELERQKRNISFDEELDYSVEYENIDLKSLQEEFDKVNRTLDMDKLFNMKLIKRENGKIYPAKALLILLGYYENVAIKCSRFKGKTMDVFIDKKEYTGNQFSQLRNAEAFILNHINIRSEIKGLQRVDIPEIPIEAIREALVNAFVHRDYSNMGRDIKLGIYDDIINIVSPGAFPNMLLEEDIASGRSEIRNKIIARVFKELGYIEQWGSGIKRIKSSCIQI